MPSRKMMGTSMSAKMMATLAFRSLAKRCTMRRSMNLDPDYRRCGKTLPWIRADERDGPTSSSVTFARQRTELWVWARYSKLTEIHKHSPHWIALCQIETASLMATKCDHRDSGIAGMGKLTSASTDCALGIKMCPQDDASRLLRILVQFDRDLRHPGSRRFHQE
jgi:hypothetical protein